MSSLPYPDKATRIRTAERQRAFFLSESKRFGRQGNKTMATIYSDIAGQWARRVRQIRATAS